MKGTAVLFSQDRRQDCIVWRTTQRHTIRCLPAKYTMSSRKKWLSRELPEGKHKAQPVIYKGVRTRWVQENPTRYRLQENWKCPQNLGRKLLISSLISQVQRQSRKSFATYRNHKSLGDRHSSVKKHISSYPLEKIKRIQNNKERKTLDLINTGIYWYIEMREKIK